MSDLNITFDELRREIGRLLSYGRISAKWTADQKHEVEAVLKRGLRQFYQPTRVDGQTHIWSFLRPRATIVIWPTVAATVSNLTYDSNTGLTTVTASASTFYQSMIGLQATFTATGNMYFVNSVPTTTSFTMSGDLSAIEAAGDIATIPSTGDYTLPEDYGGLTGPLSYEEPTYRCSLEVTTVQSIESARARLYSVASSRPTMAAVRPRKVGGVTIMRHELMVWPIPDAVYTLVYIQHTNPQLYDSLTNPYPLGAFLHGETIMESCLSIAEDRGENPRARHQGRYRERLEASVDLDRRLNTAETVGYNRDLSDERAKWPWSRDNDLSLTINDLPL